MMILQTSIIDLPLYNQSKGQSHVFIFVTILKMESKIQLTIVKIVNILSRSYI